MSKFLARALTVTVVSKVKSKEDLWKVAFQELQEDDQEGLFDSKIKNSVFAEYLLTAAENDADFKKIYSDYSEAEADSLKFAKKLYKGT